MGQCIFSQLITAGYQVELVDWLPICTKHVTSGSPDLVDKLIHIVRSNDRIYLSSTLHQHLQELEDPEDPACLDPFEVIAAFHTAT